MKLKDLGPRSRKRRAIERILGVPVDRAGFYPYEHYCRAWIGEIRIDVQLESEMVCCPRFGIHGWEPAYCYHTMIRQIRHNQSEKAISG